MYPIKLNYQGLENLTYFADDKFPPEYNKDKEQLVSLRDKILVRIANWRWCSGTKVNEQKTMAVQNVKKNFHLKLHLNTSYI